MAKRSKSTYPPQHNAVHKRPDYGSEVWHVHSSHNGRKFVGFVAAPRGTTARNWLKTLPLSGMADDLSLLSFVSTPPVSQANRPDCLCTHKVR
mmetsp:Transcript_1581/g.4692  ORF Transcript_1581/g.4692 Transcript_1581/m.4692 type:complete len:93 (-) Transcript_1581:1260-1538(-)